MTYFSTFSGVGGFELALAGHTCVGWSEIDSYASSVYRYRFPDHPAYGDITAIDAASLPDFDLLVGGFPCQDLSVAGKRAGLAGKRSGLFYDVVRILDAKKPAWFLLENVAGLLSSNGGRDMGTVLGALVDCGYGVAWRVLDSRFAGVPQRRRRVFLVGHLGDDRAGDVLALTEGLCGDSAPSGEAGESVAALTSNGVGVGGADDNQARAGHLLPLGVDFRHAQLTGDATHTLQSKDQGGHSLHYTPGVLASGDVAHTVIAHASKGGDLSSDNYVCVTGDTTHALRAEGADASEDGTGRGTPIVAFNLRGREDGAQAEVDPESLASVRAAAGGSTRTYVAVAFQTRGSNISTSERVFGTLGTKADCASGSAPMIARAVHETGHGFWQSDDTAATVRPSPGGTHANLVAFALDDAGLAPRTNYCDCGTDYRSCSDNDPCPDCGGFSGSVTYDPPIGLSIAENQRAEVLLSDTTGALKTAGGKPGQGYPAVMVQTARGNNDGAVTDDAPAVTKGYGDGNVSCATPTTVRRLTPVECERLMSWPDDHTKFGRNATGTIVAISDSRRYRMCGNGVVSAVVRQIVERLEHHASTSLVRA